jgi:phosphate transport system protein
MIVRARAAYERELKDLQDELLVMGSMVDKQIARAVESLERRDIEAARQIIRADNEIDQKRFEIEEQAILIIATQQPIASDLRVIVAVLSAIVDLERMGDHAEGIAKITCLHASQPLIKPLIDIPRMAEIGRQMLRQALDAFVARDAEQAAFVAARDDEVDALYDQVYRELLTYMIQDPASMERATWLLWAAHNLERIADRATNICERVSFLVTGRMEEVNVSKY